MRSTPHGSARNVGRASKSRYHVTWHTHDHRPLLAARDLRRRVLLSFWQAARHARVAVLAFCLVPDRVDLLIESGQSADTLRFVELVRHRTAYDYRVRAHRTLWQRGALVLTVPAGRTGLQVQRTIVELPARLGWSDRPGTFDARAVSRRVSAKPIHVGPRPWDRRH